MISTIYVTNPAGEILNINTREPRSSGLAVYNIENISSPEADVNITPVLSSGGGGLFNSSRPKVRNIVLSLALWDEAEDLDNIRRRLYKYFPLGEKIRLRLVSETRDAYIDGIVESVSVEIFTKIQTAEISLLCPDVYFRDTEIVRHVFSGTTSGFTFPFMNNSLVDDEIVFGNISTSHEKNIFYDGDATTGLIIAMRMKGPVSNIRMYNTSMSSDGMVLDDDKITTIVGSPLTVGDVVTINTKRNEKEVSLMRNGVKYNILNALGRSTSWLSLQSGDNVFVYTADSGVENAIFSTENDVLYIGV